MQQRTTQARLAVVVRLKVSQGDEGVLALVNEKGLKMLFIDIYH